MGFFDWLTPILNWFDDLISPVIPLTFILIIWALISALLGVLTFRKLCQFDRLTDTKTQLKSAQQTMIDHDGDFADLLPLAWQNIKLSLKRMGITLWPALTSIIPVMFILVFLSNRYDLQAPAQGMLVPYTVTAETEQGGEPDWYWLNQDNMQKHKQLHWPEKTTTLTLTNGDTEVFSAPFKPVGIIHKKHWWNLLIGNPAGYLSEDSPIKQITFEFPQKTVPDWMQNYLGGWLWFYLLVTVLFSVVLMIRLKIKF